MATGATLDMPSLTHLSAATDAPDLTDGLVIVAAAPAGWYDVDDDVRRWFDGRVWTNHYAPILKIVPDLESTPHHLSTNHGFHAIMVIMTLGAWAPIWVVVGLGRAMLSRERSRDITRPGQQVAPQVPAA